MGRGKEKPALGKATPEQIIRMRLLRLREKEEIASFFSKLLMMALLLAVMFGAVFGITVMKNNDMSPRISSGDLILYYRLERQFRSQDVIVFEKEGTQYVGRVVAKGGDTVEVTEDSHLKINGSTVMETDIFYPTPRFEGGISFPVELGEQEYFVLCDYRENAMDSRYFGPVSQKEIKGRVMAVLRRSSL